MCRSLPIFWMPTALRLQKLLMENCGSSMTLVLSSGSWTLNGPAAPSSRSLAKLAVKWVCLPACLPNVGQGHKDQDGQTAQEGCQQFHQRKTAFS